MLHKPSPAKELNIHKSFVIYNVTCFIEIAK